MISLIEDLEIDQCSFIVNFFYDDVYQMKIVLDSSAFYSTSLLRNK